MKDKSTTVPNREVIFVVRESTFLAILISKTLGKMFSSLLCIRHFIPTKFVNMRFLLLLFLTSFFFSCGNVISVKEKEKHMRGVSIYDYGLSFRTIDGKSFNLSHLKGKKVMIVNMASKCGLTFQCEYLEQLYRRYKKDDFVVIGFPSNNFFDQEPGSNKEIKTFYERNYAVSFPIMEKTNVLGDSISPVYKFLTQKDENGLVDSQVEWNFQKYLIDEFGFLTKVVAPQVPPTDDRIVDWILNSSPKTGCPVTISGMSCSSLNK